MLLHRYGVVFRRLCTREPWLPPWRELVAVYRRREARGELRGGRFLTLAIRIARDGRCDDGRVYRRGERRVVTVEHILR